MSYELYRRMSDLHHLIDELGQRGGLISPSVYDTAQVLRLTPELVDRPATVAWLLAQQHPDGGWGLPSAGRARDLPTLAALLALHTRAPEAAQQVRAGVRFLQHHAPFFWEGTPPEDIPVGAELLLPDLIERAARAGLPIPQRPYESLTPLRARRRALIAQMRPAAGSAPAHSWEGWGDDPDIQIIDGSGGIGHSPAATAAWLDSSAGRPDLEAARARAGQYLRRASAATCALTPGIMPTVWPINRFEQIWSLYALFAAGLLNAPHLAEMVRPQLDSLAQAMRPAGIGMSDSFIVDGDITATALAVLTAAGRATDRSTLRRFQKGDSFFTYPHELQPSLTTTAHAVLALALYGEDVSRPVRFLEQRQQPDGRWAGDKWHSSWLYTTAQVIIALARANALAPLLPAIEALLREQHRSGGWGESQHATLAETAYAALALHSVRIHPAIAWRVQPALERAGGYLFSQYECMAANNDPYWIGKELYCPYRVDHAHILSAIVVLTTDVPVLLEHSAGARAPAYAAR